MSLSEDFVKRIEIQYLAILLELSQAKQITRAQAKGSAQLLLSYLPFHDEEDIKHKLGNFKEIYPMFMKLYTYLLNELEKESTKDVLEKMRHLMNNEDVDSAIKLAETSS